MQIIDITQSQRKILVGIALGLLAFLIVWFGFYRPLHNKVCVLKSEVADAEQLVRQIEANIGTSVFREEGFRQIKEKFDLLMKRFPSKEEDGIKMIYATARKIDIEIISLQPLPKENCGDESGQPVSVEGRTCAKIPLLVKIKGAYKDVTRFLEALKDSSSLFASVESVKLSKAEAGTAKVLVSLTLNLYLLS